MRTVLAWAALALGIVVLFDGSPGWGCVGIVVWLVVLDEKRGEA